MAAASTPAIAILTSEGIDHVLHSYDHDDRSDSFGSEAADVLADRLGIAREQVFKTLIVERSDRSLAVAMVPVTGTLSLKAMAAASDTRKVVLAPRAAAQRSSGYVFGGISPLGQRRRLDTVIDRSVSAFDRVFCSAGRRGLEVELHPHDLVRLTCATTAPIAAP